MPKSTAPYVIVYISNDNTHEHGEPTLCHEVCGTEDEAKLRFAELVNACDGEILVFRDMPVPAEVETTPRVTFGVAHKPLDAQPKVKRKRRTRAEMEVARLNGEAKPKKVDAVVNGEAS